MNRIFEPHDREYEARIRHSFDRQMVMKTIKASIDHISPGKVEINFPYQPEFTQQLGFIHAGIVSTVLDSACGYATYSLPKDLNGKVKSFHDWSLSALIDVAKDPGLIKLDTHKFSHSLCWGQLPINQALSQLVAIYQIQERSCYE